ncbi:FHA domain-containing protein [Streptomyces bohaiensis]|uniref:FHA domain-containing protein n=1 Tax=Streptomyces bohaiensis TaxID=1431344 RepID=A0ABX1C8A6_9ACTN|nr:FHA domain-containing protein [Streptomyces bohaiensis]NJQ15389.1 FHA domain-containing protein [Streptomyces bohaiensis]
MTTADETAALAVQDADRVQALTALREGVAQRKVSPETFQRRMEIVVTAEEVSQLFAATADLAQRRPRGRVVRTVGRASAFHRRLRRAWDAEQLPRLVLPAPGRHPISVGRAPGSVLRISDASVSRFHAQLKGVGETWTVRDIGSANGTWVNGARVMGAAPVGPGDTLRFGSVGYLVAEPGAGAVER